VSLFLGPLLRKVTCCQRPPSGSQHLLRLVVLHMGLPVIPAVTSLGYCFLSVLFLLIPEVTIYCPKNNFPFLTALMGEA
jgi:hypothetical protein